LIVNGGKRKSGVPFPTRRCAFSRKIQLDQARLLDLLAQGFVVRRLQIHFGYARSSLLALHKNLRRSRILPN
jgi:hypothetical protein